ncbi:uncharacterized protein ACDP82_003845 [Pangshura tecta]
MMEKGHSRDSVQCRVKVKELRQAYQKTKEANGRSGAGPKTCRFYAELHAILGGCATSTPPLSLDSDVGVVIAMAEDYADGEEYDEEVDEDNLAESTQHSISPNSQELFLTQTELASQPSQDNEAMEETSAANFSSLPTPSQRLAKIRRRKKTTRDEMFSDIMEVTRKERAHLNEWKEVVSNYRKDASEREDRRDTRDERWWQEDQRWRDATLGLLHDQTDMLWHLELSATIWNKEDIFSCVVWAIGEYMSISYNKRCTVEQINKFFEALEAMLFEITQLRLSTSIPQVFATCHHSSHDNTDQTSITQPRFHPQNVSVPVQDESICSETVMASVYSEEDNEEILTWALELMNLLKMPTVAQFVLCHQQRLPAHGFTETPTCPCLSP